MHKRNAIGRRTWSKMGQEFIGQGKRVRFSAFCSFCSCMSKRVAWRMINRWKFNFLNLKRFPCERRIMDSSNWFCNNLFSWALSGRVELVYFCQFIFLFVWTRALFIFRWLLTSDSKQGWNKINTSMMTDKANVLLL